jgi:cell division protein FtsB
VFVPRCNRLNALQRRKAALESKNRALEMETRELRTKQERFLTDPGFVEHTARETGMVKPGETVFRFTNDPNAVTAGARP